MKIKPSKTHLLKRSTDFLGHVVSYRGIEPQIEKIAAVKAWPRPLNVHDLKGFLGLYGYYRRFILGFAKTASPLYELLRKNSKFQWTECYQTAFEELKSALTSVLEMPNDVDSFIVDTDASNDSVGAVLSQIQNGQEVVIAYASRRLSQAEKIIVSPGVNSWP